MSRAAGVGIVIDALLTNSSLPAVVSDSLNLHQKIG
jgi:hypothetical protein